MHVFNSWKQMKNLELNYNLEQNIEQRCNKGYATHVKPETWLYGKDLKASGIFVNPSGGNGTQVRET